jgi:TRAP-type C4-dicarboxylate transport system permease small subunit
MQSRPPDVDLGTHPPAAAPMRSVCRFGILECLVVVFAALVLAGGWWIATEGISAAMASTGFQYLGLGAIVIGFGIATRATERMLRNGTIVDRRDALDS